MDMEQVMSVKLTAGALMDAIDLGEHLERVSQMRRAIAFDGNRGKNDLLINLSSMKRALRAAVRAVEMLEHHVARSEDPPSPP